MNKKMLAVILIAAAVALVGCKALLTQTAPANSIPVSVGAATTNDINAVAWVKTVAAANSSLNPTPTEQPLNALFSALIPLISAAAGFYTRHSLISPTTASTGNVPPPAKI